MNHIEYLRDLRHRSNGSKTHEIEARPYKNAQGVDELIFLQKGYWRYVDWAEKNTEIDFANWVVHCCNYPSEGFSLSHLLMYWLWLDHCARFYAGDPTPNDYPPMGYEEWAQEVEAEFG